MCRSLAVFGYYLKQPKVIFEIIGGVLLGPSAIGKDTTFTNTIFPTSSLNYLTLVSQMGLVLYLFVVGMELDPKLIVSHARRTGGIALMGMVIICFLYVISNSSLLCRYKFYFLILSFRLFRFVSE
jgi:Kef-type K+ transport system membrane component KefB